jgi:hypothetical protein
MNGVLELAGVVRVLAVVLGMPGVDAAVHAAEVVRENKGDKMVLSNRVGGLIPSQIQINIPRSMVGAFTQELWVMRSKQKKMN